MFNFGRVKVEQKNLQTIQKDVIPNPCFFKYVSFHLCYLQPLLDTPPKWQGNPSSLRIHTPQVLRSATIRKPIYDKLVGLKRFFVHLIKKNRKRFTKEGYVVHSCDSSGFECFWLRAPGSHCFFFFFGLCCFFMKNTCWNVPKAWCMSSADLAPPCWTAYFRHKHPKWSACFFWKKNDCNLQHPYPENTWNMVNLPTWMVALYSTCR